MWYTFKINNVLYARALHIHNGSTIVFKDPQKFIIARQPDNPILVMLSDCPDIFATGETEPIALSNLGKLIQSVYSLKFTDQKHISDDTIRLVAGLPEIDLILRGVYGVNEEFHASVSNSVFTDCFSDILETLYTIQSIITLTKAMTISEILPPEFYIDVVTKLVCNDWYVFDFSKLELNDSLMVSINVVNITDSIREVNEMFPTIHEDYHIPLDGIWQSLFYNRVTKSITFDGKVISDDNETLEVSELGYTDDEVHKIINSGVFELKPKK